MAAIATGGSGNWSSTTNNAPWAGGVVPVEGDTVTIANTHTVTINQNITVGADSATAAIAISSGGKLQVLSTAAATYTLTLKGELSITGTAEFGTSANPIPLNRLFTIKTNYSATPSDGKYGITVNSGGVLRSYGATMTVVAAKLAANASATATSLTTDVSTGWKNGDSIILASTTRTATETEKKALSADAVTTALTIAAITNAHSGTSPTQGELINLNRAVIITSNVTTSAGYIFIASGGVIDCQYVEFSYLGANSTGKRGIEYNSTSTSNIQYNSLHDFRNYGMVISNANSVNPNNLTYSNNVHYNLDTQTVGNSFRIDSTSGSSITISGNYFLGCNCVNNDSVLKINDVGSTFTNNVVAGSGTGSGSTAIMFEEGSDLGTISGNTTHSNAGIGQRTNSTFTQGTMSTMTSWRNNDSGFRWAGGCSFFTLDTGTFFGNTNQNLMIDQHQGYIECKSLTVNGDASYSTTNGFRFSSSCRVFISDSTFGVTTAHTGQDLSLSDQNVIQVECFNVTLGSTTQATINNSISQGCTVRVYKIGQTTAHKSFYTYGTIQADTTTRHTASGFSWKMTPSQNSPKKLLMPGPNPYDTFKAAVNASTLVTIKVWVQKDGSYNGVAPRLVLKGNTIGGIASDVTASLTVAASTWEQLTVTGTPNEAGVVDFYIDCDGTAGNVYVDDITISQA